MFMNKALQSTIIAGIVIITLSTSYYLVIFLPKKEAMRLEQQKQETEQQKQRELEAKKTKCLEDAKKFHQDYKNSTENSITNYVVFDPQYTFNEKIGKCLYDGGYSYVYSYGSGWEKVVIDVYTNETIISAFSSIGKDTQAEKEDQESFEEKRAELMGYK